MNLVLETLKIYGGARAVAQYERELAHLTALRRIVQRALACHQLEKLEDARPYLGDEAGRPAPAYRHLPDCACGRCTGWAPEPHSQPCGCQQCVAEDAENPPTETGGGKR